MDECETTPCKCAKNIFGYAATCNNTNGSFQCSCKSGFKLAYDNQICTGSL